MKKKRQHIIPKCYQKPWCDPRTPHNQTPYLWLVSKDGGQKKRKAPVKAFVGSDVYTVRLATGERELLIEETLARIESKFVSLASHKISKQYRLDSCDRADLCVFAAAMFARVDPQGRTYEKFMQEIHETVVSLEEAHSAEPRTSLETAAMLDIARPPIHRYFAPNVG